MVVLQVVSYDSTDSQNCSKTPLHCSVRQATTTNDDGNDRTQTRNHYSKSMSLVREVIDRLLCEARNIAD